MGQNRKWWVQPRGMWTHIILSKECWRVVGGTTEEALWSWEGSGCSRQHKQPPGPNGEACDAPAVTSLNSHLKQVAVLENITFTVWSYNHFSQRKPQWAFWRKTFFLRPLFYPEGMIFLCYQRHDHSSESCGGKVQDETHTALQDAAKPTAQSSLFKRVLDPGRHKPLTFYLSDTRPVNITIPRGPKTDRPQNWQAPRGQGTMSSHRMNSLVWGQGSLHSALRPMSSHLALAEAAAIHCGTCTSMEKSSTWQNVPHQKSQS